MSNSERWNLRGGVWERESDGFRTVNIKATAYPVGAWAGTCEMGSRMCYAYTCQEVTVGPCSAPVARTQLWARTNNLLMSFDATDPRYGEGSQVNLNW